MMTEADCIRNVIDAVKEAHDMADATIARYRTALEKIAAHEIDGPLDEWAEAGAYHETRDIARKALTQGE